MRTPEDAPTDPDALVGNHLMRHDTANTLRRAARPAVMFQCSACDHVHFAQSEATPRGWSIEEVDDELHAFCPPCAAEREAERIAGVAP